MTREQEIECPGGSMAGHMGVDHGGTCPPEYGVGGANVNCPLQVFVIGIQKGAFCGIQLHQNPFSAGALPGPRWGV